MSNFKTARFSDFSGGINLRNSPDRIDDNQFQELVNMSSEGNKLTILKGFKLITQLTSSAGKVQGIKLFSNYLVCVFNTNLYIYNLSTGVLTIKTSVVVNSTDRYQIVVNKLLDISIVIINTNPSTTEDVKAYEFDLTTLTITSQSFTGLTNKNFKCGGLYEGKLLLGGNPSSPSFLYYSKTVSATSPLNIYDFSGYSSSSQPVGDGEAIVGFASNNTEFFIFKTNSIWKIVSSIDDKTTYLYQLRQETATGCINVFSIVNAEKDIIYFDGTTIRRISYEANTLALSDVSIGKDIEVGISSLSQSQKENCFMVYSYPYVKLYLKSNTSSVVDFAIVYNVVDKGFSTQVGVDGSIGTNGIYNNKRACFIGSQFDSSIFQDNETSTYNNSDISFSCKSKKVNFGDGVNFKQFVVVDFNGVISLGLDATIKLYVDGREVASKSIQSSLSSNSSTTISPTMGSSPFGATPIGGNNQSIESSIINFQTKFELYHGGREIEFTINGVGQGMLDLNGNAITYKHIKGYPIH